MPALAGRRKREIRDQDVQGLKCLRKIRPLLSRLRKVGTERDRAGNRRLFMDQYCALILVELGHTIRSRPDRRFDAVGQRITALSARGVRCCACGGIREGLPMSSSGLWEQAQPGWRSAADTQ